MRSAFEVDVEAAIEAYERRAFMRDANRSCENARRIYSGAISVDATEYRHRAAHDGQNAMEELPGLDDVFSRNERVTFALEYPFENGRERYTGEVTAPVTLRRTIDAIRAGFRTMYAASSIEAIESVDNRRVTGPYGEGFHDIGDLVIERIDLCRDGTLLLFIGS